MAAILVFLAGQETASATVPKPARDIDLATYNDRPKGMWSDGTNFYVIEGDSRWGGQYLVMIIRRFQRIVQCKAMTGSIGQLQQ